MAVARQSSVGVVHFGERLRASKFGHSMTREMYAYPNRSPHSRRRREEMPDGLWEGVSWAYADEEHTELSDVFLVTQRDAALVNFDMSLRYFASLDPGEFELALERVLAAGNGFTPVQSLVDWDGVEGVYVMVFDEYRQFYVGQSGDLRKRIKGHWSKRKSFDRVLFGGPYDSILAVDELRALDTTRIYALATADPFDVERRTEAAADRRFCLNRMMGGEPDSAAAIATLVSPRSRVHDDPAAVMTREAYESAVEHIAQVIARPRPAYDDGLASELAALDMTVFVLARDDGSEVMWSRRDAIRQAARRGDLSIADYELFLEAMGETVVWPAPRATAD